MSNLSFRLAILLLLGLFAARPALSQDTVLPEGDAAAGRTLYMTGIGADGMPVRAMTKGDIAIDGTQVTCVSCHRPSGMGTSEGGSYVSPITAGTLFNERKPNLALRLERFREYYKDPQTNAFKTETTRGRLRPAFTDETLAAAIRTGIDPAGRELDDVMPRFVLSDQDAANLVAFMKTLSPEPSEGVDQFVHFATIIAGDIAPETADAHEKLMTMFADWINKDIVTDLSRPGFSPYYRSDFTQSYREWRMHVWKLDGPPESWPAKLDAYYEQQPVFAVIGPLVEADYSPVAEFCNRRATPCILPSTELPAPGDQEGGYTLYFSRGLLLEADAAALWLSREATLPRHILQISLGGPLSDRPAAQFLKAATTYPDLKVETRSVADEAELREALETAGRDDALLIWSGNRSDEAIRALNASQSRAGLILLTSKAHAAAVATLDPKLREKTRLIWPYDKPTAYHADGLRVRAWIRSRRLPITEWRYQLQGYYAMKTTEFAMGHLLSDYYKDYLIEIIEHDIGAGFDPGPHPRLSLGPSQRYASKGAFIMRFDDAAKDGIEPITDWLIP
ncbi:MAG: ABC transporter substrate-binding protein [Rhodothalassiaceae bacterium]